MHVLHLFLKPSKVFSRLMLLILLGSLISIFYANLSYYMQFPLVLLTLVYGRKVIRKDVLLKDQKSVVSLIGHDDNTWWLNMRSQEVCQASLCGDSTIIGIMSILRFKIAGQKEQRTCVIFQDAIGSAQYRRLLMMLRTIKVKEPYENS